MKRLQKALAMSALLACVLGTSLAPANADSSGRWVCKTPPVYNGRSSMEQLTTGSTRDQAFGGAVSICNHSGFTAECIRLISCWQG